MEILFNSPDNYLTLISNQVKAGISLLVNNGAVHIEVCIYLYLLRYLQISTIPSMSQGHHIPVSLSSLTLVQPRALNLTSNVFRAEVAARFAAGEYVTISRGADGDISSYVEVEDPVTRAQDSVIRGNKLQLTYARSPWSLLARDFDIHDIYTH